MEALLGPPLEALGRRLLQAEAGVLLGLLVGLSMSLSHAFALLANRLTPRQIALRLVLDGLNHNGARGPFAARYRGVVVAALLELLPPLSSPAAAAS